MCMICVDLMKDKLTAWEATKNLEEMVDDMSSEHKDEVIHKIWGKFEQERLADKGDA